LEIAFARTVKRAALAVPENVEDFVDQYLAVSRDSYALVNENVKRDCNIIVDGTKDIESLANEIVSVLLNSFS
jgi:hypothetical protein